MFSTLYKKQRSLANLKERFIFGVLFFRLWLFPGGPFRPVGGEGVRSHISHPPADAPGHHYDNMMTKKPRYQK